MGLPISANINIPPGVFAAVVTAAAANGALSICHIGFIVAAAAFVVIAGSSNSSGRGGRNARTRRSGGGHYRHLEAVVVSRIGIHTGIIRVRFEVRTRDVVLDVGWDEFAHAARMLEVPSQFCLGRQQRVTVRTLHFDAAALARQGVPPGGHKRRRQSRWSGRVGFIFIVVVTERDVLVVNAFFLHGLGDDVENRNWRHSLRVDG
jgi:hypothetical protein